jgi:predicted nucleic acid-binding protein
VRLPDVSLLLHAVDEASSRHLVARAWLEGRLSGSETVTFAWGSLLAFVRLSTRALEAGDRDFGRFRRLLYHDPLSA